jgi:hypothetical protein
MEKVLVIDGCGFIGSHIVDRLWLDGYEVQETFRFYQFHQIASKQTCLKYVKNPSRCWMGFLYLFCILAKQSQLFLHKLQNRVSQFFALQRKFDSGFNKS